MPLNKPPKIDGILDDACWDETAPRTVSAKRELFFRYDAECLYVALREVHALDRKGERQPWILTSQGPDAAVWNDSNCQIFIGQEDAKSCLQFAVSGTGARYDSLYVSDPAAPPKTPCWKLVKEDVGWTGPWASAAQVKTGELTIEMAIPWEMIKKQGLDRNKLIIDVVSNGRMLNNVKTGRYRPTPTLKKYHKYVPVTFQTLLLYPQKGDASQRYALRFHFAEPDDVAPGQRRFDVVAQGQKVLTDVDVVKETGGRLKALVKEVKGISAGTSMSIRFIPRNDKMGAILSALEVVREK